MYILSRDRLNMDLDRSCLDLMIRLLELDQDQGSGAVSESPVQFSAKEIAKMKEKIRKLCDTVHNKHLDLQNITVQEPLKRLGPAQMCLLFLLLCVRVWRRRRDIITSAGNICSICRNATHT